MLIEIILSLVVISINNGHIYVYVSLPHANHSRHLRGNGGGMSDICIRHADSGQIFFGVPTTLLPLVVSLPSIHRILPYPFARGVLGLMFCFCPFAHGVHGLMIYFCVQESSFFDLRACLLPWAHLVSGVLQWIYELFCRRAGAVGHFSAGRHMEVLPIVVWPFWLACLRCCRSTLAFSVSLASRGIFFVIEDLTLALYTRKGHTFKTRFAERT